MAAPEVYLLHQRGGSAFRRGGLHAARGRDVRALLQRHLLRWQHAPGQVRRIVVAGTCAQWRVGRRKFGFTFEVK